MHGARASLINKIGCPITITKMNLAIRIAAAILSVPPDVLAPMVCRSRWICEYASDEPCCLTCTHLSITLNHPRPTSTLLFQVPMIAPPPQNQLEMQLRDEIDSVLSGSCCTASNDAPLFAISQSESKFVDCQSGLPSVSTDGDLFARSKDDIKPSPSTYGEVTMLGSRQLFHHMGLASSSSYKQGNERDYQFYDLGSGGGRLVIQSHLELPHLSRSVGIELSSSRHSIAMQTWEELEQSGNAERIRRFAKKAWGKEDDDFNDMPSIELHEGDLFKLDISKATHIYVSSLCFSEDMLERLVEKVESEAISLQILASLRLLPLQRKDQCIDGDEAAMCGKKRLVQLGVNPWMEFVEMSWTKARGDGCPVYFYSATKLT